ncbi:MAG TPA: PAS domain S-box protein [Geobacteraceae bacterium]
MSLRAQRSPLRLFISLIITVLTTETVITVFVHSLPTTVPVLVETVVEVVLLLGVLFPILYKKVLSPLLHEMTIGTLTAEALRASEERYRFLVGNLHDIIWELDGEFRVTFVTPSVQDVLGYTTAEVLGMSAVDMLTPASQEKFATILAEVHACQASSPGERTFMRTDELELVDKDGQAIWTEISGTLVFSRDNRLQTILGVTRVISDRKQAEKALKDACNLLEKTISSLNEAVFIVNTQTRIVEEVNGVAVKMFGYSREELIGTHTSLFHVNAEMSRQFGEEMLRAYEEKGFFETTFRMKRKDGSVFDSEHSVVPIVTDDGSYLSHVCVVRDISERVRSRERLEASLKEKEILLREVHHRVGNNLQIITSLLGLQRRYFTDGYHIDLFEDSCNRIATLALIYESLSNSASLNEIDFSCYVKNLLSRLNDACRVDPAAVNCHITTTDVILDIDAAVPCGLIINELVSNSFRFAFPEGRKGRVEVELGAGPDGRFLLTVRDDGVGLPPGFDVFEPATLGFRLVNLFVEQLGGEMACSTGEGTKFAISFGTTNGRELA